MLPRLLAHVGLSHAAQRKQGAAELLLGQPKQEISLILREVGGTLQQPSSALVVVLDPSIVPGRQQVGANLPCRDQELVKLQVIVAETTRNRCTARKILFDERLHHVPLEALLLVDDVIRNAEGFGHASRVVHIIQGAATSL